MIAVIVYRSKAQTVDRIEEENRLNVYFVDEAASHTQRYETLLLLPLALII